MSYEGAMMLVDFRVPSRIKQALRKSIPGSWMTDLQSYRLRCAARIL